MRWSLAAALLVWIGATTAFAVEADLASSDRDEGRTAGGGNSETVDVRDNSFSPADLTIEEGETVVWEQSGTGQHSVTADDGSFDSHPNCPPACMRDGDTFQNTFEEPGTFRYYCKLHGGEDGAGMAGRVVVRTASDGASGDRDDEDRSSRSTSEGDDGAIAATGAFPGVPAAAGLALVMSGVVIRLAARQRVGRPLDRAPR